MNPIPFAKTTGAHFVAALLATAAMACDGPPVFDIGCRDLPDCPADGGQDGPRRDTPPPPDGAVVDSGPSRSLLCGTSGCFPGNWMACDQMPKPDAAFLATPMQDDASDDASPDALADASPDTSSEGGDADASADVTTDTCSDHARDGSSIDVSADARPPDASDDVATEPDIISDDVADAIADNVADTTPPTRDVGLSDSSVPPDATADGPADADAADTPTIVQSCYIRPAATGVVTECAPVGAGVDGSACNDSRDCGPLLACVEVDQRPACRAVKCALPPVCSRGTYYQEAALRANGVTRRDINVPVCLPVDRCTLLAQPSPCPAGKVCAVVGSEGDTTCLEPGSAKVGEPCAETNRCAEGLLCSRFSNQCVQICHIATGSEACPSGTCQGGNNSLPDGFGICVGQN